jgi:hypothetical protein
MFWREKTGTRFELGTYVCVGVTCNTTGLRCGDFLNFVASQAIANVIPSMLCLVVRWCVHGVVWTIVCVMGFVVFVTDEAGLTVCP